ncbi:MAG: YceI family protein [Planctomycetota bacterium]|nr:YceI family protein [Planctomycetota bacterium]
MKYTLLLALPALLAAPFLLSDGSATSAAAPSTSSTALKPAAFKVDATHSWVLFKINHLGLGTAWGSFNDFSGNFVLDSEKTADSSVSMTIDAGSVDTNNKKRNDHLKGPDFFNAKEFPTITFTSSKVTGKGDNFQVTGTLTLLGKEKEITVDVKMVGEGGDPWGNHRAGFEGSFTLDRTDFGMDFMKDGGLGSEVSVTLAFEGIRE